MNYAFWLLVLGVVANASKGMAQPPGSFAATGNMMTPRAGHTATLLNDGRVLITGGVVDDRTKQITASAELYDLSSGVFTPTGNMTIPRADHSATLLSTGKVLIAGGVSNYAAAATATAELYDPSTGVFTQTADMTAGRAWHSSTLLNSGKVLIAGGYSNGAGGEASAELYDPSTRRFTPAGSMTIKRPTPRATVLADGKVLIVPGGDGSDETAELYDPATDMFHAAGWTGTSISANTANLLPNGKVLVTLATPECDYPGSAAWEFDPAAEASAFVGSMIKARCFQRGTSLSDGSVLITGSFCCGPDIYTAEIFNPVSGVFSQTGDLTWGRYSHTSTLLQDGRVLIAGGDGFLGPPGTLNSGGNSVLRTAEVFNPPSVIPSPVLFSVNGHEQGAIWDGSTGEIASPESPTVAGASLSMYTTSLIAGGAIPPQVVVGGQVADILYFGDAPGYPGYNQVNFRVPDGVAPGSAVPVRLIYLGRSSNAVTISLY